MEDRVARLREVCDLAPGLELARARAEELLSTAMGRLQAIPDPAVRETLGRAGSFILQRRF